MPLGQPYGFFLLCGIKDFSLDLAMSLFVLSSVWEGDGRLYCLIPLGNPGDGHLGDTWN